jgi:hypothetical protein
LVGFVAVTSWAKPALLLVVLPLVYVLGFVYVRRMDRRTAASIEANVRQAVARRDRLLARR